MKVKGAYCDNCQAPLEGEIMLLLPRRNSEQWLCQRCGRDLTAPGVVLMSTALAGLACAAGIYWVLRTLFEAKNPPPLPFAQWAFIYMGSLFLGIAVNMGLNYAAYYWVYKTRVNKE